MLTNYIEELEDKNRPYMDFPEVQSQPSLLSWKPPDEGWWKLNSDASWSSAAMRGGVGWVIRDSAGSLIGAGCSRVSHYWPIKDLEGEAICLGLNA